jgi:hypothetical protein
MRVLGFIDWGCALKEIANRTINPITGSDSDSFSNNMKRVNGDVPAINPRTLASCFGLIPLYLCLLLVRMHPSRSLFFVSEFEERVFR